jgi:hypothetical protein
MKFVLLTKHTELDVAPPSSEWSNDDLAGHMARLEALSARLAKQHELVTMVAFSDPEDAILVRSRRFRARGGWRAQWTGRRTRRAAIDGGGVSRSCHRDSRRSLSRTQPDGRPLGQPIELRAVVGESDPENG